MLYVALANYKVTHTLALYCYSLQIEALFDLIKGLIKDMDGAQDDEVRPDPFMQKFAVIFFLLLSDVVLVQLDQLEYFSFNF